MKKALCVMLAVCLAAAFLPAAAAPDGQKIQVSYLEMEQGKEMDFMTERSIVAKNAQTGKILPLSECDNGYLYAFGSQDVQPVQATAVSFSEGQTVSEDYYISFLSRRGIFTGNEAGAFLPDEPLTLAQAAVVLDRIFSPTPAAGEGSWYGGAVQRLGQSGVFSEPLPQNLNKAITRQELVLFTCRVLSGMGALKTGGSAVSEEQLAHVEDLNELTAEAKEAYALMLDNGYGVMLDYVYENMENLDEYITAAKGNQAITRRDAAAFLTGTMRTFLRSHRPAIAKQAAIEAGLGEQMPKIDGSTSTYPITTALYFALFENGQNHEAMPESHSKTTASYEKLIAGEADVIFVPDPSEAVKQLAADKGVELKYIPIANEALIFFTGKGNSAQGLTSEQIRNIYVDNAYQNWSQVGGPNAPLAAFCRNNDSGSHAQMERFFLNGNEINADIRRERTSVMMASILTDVQNYEAQHPGEFALGYSMFYYYQNAGQVIGTEDLKLLAVDGVAPSEASIADKTYPLSTSYYAVVRAGTPDDAPAMRLVNWLLTDGGKACLVNAGFGPSASIE